MAAPVRRSRLPSLAWLSSSDFWSLGHSAVLKVVWHLKKHSASTGHEQGSKFSSLLSKWKLPRDCFRFWTRKMRFRQERESSPEPGHQSCEFLQFENDFDAQHLPPTVSVALSSSPTLISLSEAITCRAGLQPCLRHPDSTLPRLPVSPGGLPCGQVALGWKYL